MKATSKEEKALWECYRRLFAAATPAGDFDLMVENAEIDEQGRKHIPFMDYEIEDDTMKAIITGILKEYRIPKWRHRAFNVAIYLGCSPKTKIKKGINEEED